VLLLTVEDNSINNFIVVSIIVITVIHILIVEHIVAVVVMVRTIIEVVHNLLHLVVAIDLMSLLEAFHHNLPFTIF